MKKENKGKTVFVLGGSGGIGKEISKKFGQEGYNLIIHGSNLKKLEILKEKIEEETQYQIDIKLLSLSFDNEKISEAHINLIKAHMDLSDIFIHCYGPFLQKEIHNTTETEWESIVYWNYTFPGQLISYALNSMMKKKYGSIVIFGGTRTDFVNGFRTNAIYGGAKTALCSLVKSVAAEYGKYGITCNGIIPGFIETEYLTEKTKINLKEKMPLKKLISPENIANAIFFLVSCRNINGALLNVDQGWMP